MAGREWSWRGSLSGQASVGVGVGGVEALSSSSSRGTWDRHRVSLRVVRVSWGCCSRLTIDKVCLRLIAINT